jgi:hypothetical protein
MMYIQALTIAAGITLSGIAANNLTQVNSLPATSITAPTTVSNEVLSRGKEMDRAMVQSPPICDQSRAILRKVFI